MDEPKDGRSPSGDGSGDRYRALFQALPVGIYRTTPDGRILEGNPALAKILGYSSVEALMKVNTLDLYVDLADRALWCDLMERKGVVTGLEVRKWRADRSVVWLRDSARAVIENGETVAYEGVVIDITGVMSVEASLKLSEERYRTLVEAMPDAMLRIRSDGLCLDATPGHGDLLPVQPSDIVGRPLRETLPAEIADKLLAAAAISLEAQEPLDVQLRLSVPMPRELIARVTALGDDVALIILRDRTQAERMRAQLLRTERLASVGMLAAGVAHEINNPLGYLSTNLELALEASAGALEGTSDQDPREALAEVRRSLDDALHGAKRVQKIVAQLKGFSREEDDLLRPIDLDGVLETSCRMVRNQVRHRARLEPDFGGLPKVMGTASRLEQVFVNLLVNAAQAIPEGEADENVVRLTAEVVRGRVVVEVSDSGKGIAPEHLDRIFDPFFTTKPIGEGTGLGLAVCHDIVAACGGQMDVESKIGEGSTFRVSLSVAKARSVPVPARRSVHPPRGRARVLVVDDEPLLGRSLARALERSHDVAVLQDPREAVRRLSEGERFDVIFCDVMMPVMGGMEVHVALTESAPEMAERVVFITGGAFSGKASDYIHGLENPVLQKPLSIDEVRRRVVDALAHHGS